MFNHGVTAAALFWFIAMLQERTGGHRGIDQFGGLRKPAPVLAGLMGIVLFSSLGLPGLNGFVGEFLIFRGVFPLSWVAATVSSSACLSPRPSSLPSFKKYSLAPCPNTAPDFPICITANVWPWSPSSASCSSSASCPNSLWAA